MTRTNLKLFVSFGLGFFLLLLIGYSCEKDDICVDGDTPLLIIRFYDAADTTLVKPVNALRVIGLNQELPVNTFTDRTSLDSIAIPLDLENNFTDFIFISDSTDENEMETGNRDTLRFSYTVAPEFVSRACGFVGRYEGVTSQITPDTLNWVQESEILISKIITQDSAHVKIFH